MDKSVYIVHGSVIVQNGLADIIRKNFKCDIKCYSDIASFFKFEQNCASNAILFVDDLIATSMPYIELLDDCSDVKSFRVLCCDPEGEKPNNKDTLFISDSPDEIYEKVKHAFKQQESGVNEPEGLSNREIDVLKLVALGYANKEIANQLFISTHTVMSHRKNMTEKLGIKSISGLTVYAIINNYIDTTNIDAKDLI